MRDIQYRDNDRPEDLLEELGYETQDIHYKKFSVYGAYFFGFLIASAIAGFIIMYFMVPTKLSGGRMSSYVPKTQMPDSTPLLQTNITAKTDIMSLRRKESEILDTNGVVNRAKGEYRISIDDAINILAQKGLPKTAAVPSNGDPGANIKVGSFGGRVFPGTNGASFLDSKTIDGVKIGYNNGAPGSTDGYVKSGQGATTAGGNGG